MGVDVTRASCGGTRLLCFPAFGSVKVLNGWKIACVHHRAGALANYANAHCVSHCSGLKRKRDGDAEERDADGDNDGAGRLQSDLSVRAFAKGAMNHTRYEGGSVPKGGAGDAGDDIDSEATDVD